MDDEVGREVAAVAFSSADIVRLQSGIMYATGHHVLGEIEADGKVRSGRNFELNRITDDDGAGGDGNLRASAEGEHPIAAGGDFRAGGREP